MNTYFLIFYKGKCFFTNKQQKHIQSLFKPNFFYTKICFMTLAGARWFSSSRFIKFI